MGCSPGWHPSLGKLFVSHKSSCCQPRTSKNSWQDWILGGKVFEISFSDSHKILLSQLSPILTYDSREWWGSIIGQKCQSTKLQFIDSCCSAIKRDELGLQEWNAPGKSMPCPKHAVSSTRSVHLLSLSFWSTGILRLENTEKSLDIGRSILL